MSFLTPLAFLGALIAIPIILLYMLRLRRREIVISSTFLWQQVLHDQEANTPWQRLRRNLLLLLQLLILALLILTLARPFITVPAVSSGQTALLLDASASMNATDINGGSRFDEAKRRALDIVDTMSTTDVMTVIRVADVAEVLSPYTDNRDVLRAAINTAQPSESAGNWVAALTLASAKAASTEDFHVVIISDGGLGQAVNLPTIQGELRYVPVGNSGSNQAITALATRSLPGQAPELFSQIHNYAAQPAEMIFSLRVDGQLFASERYTVPAQGDLPIVSRALPTTFTTLQASIAPAASSSIPDYLAEDDNAWAVFSAGSARRVLLMTDGNLFLEQVLRTLPGLEVLKGDPKNDMPSQPFDLYIFDGYLPPKLPDADLFIINPPRSSSLFTVGETSQNTQNLVQQRDDPRMIYVDFANVHVLKFTPITGADWAAPLVRVDGGALLLAGETGGRRVAILPFDLHDSDLPLQIAFPVLMSNLVNWFTPRALLDADSSALKVGSSLVIHPPLDADTVRVTRPDSSQRDLTVDRDTLVFGDTQQPGLYQVQVFKAGSVVQTQPFAVNLFDANESSIAPVPPDQLKLGGTTVVTTGKQELGQREYWQEAALLALLILLIEWWVYQRRLRIPTIMSPALRKRRVG